MFSLASLGLRLPSFGRSSSLTPSINIPSVEIHDIEENPEKRARTLKHLLKANHINHAVIYHKLQFHNHTPHILGSAYLLGASPEQLNTIYDEESKVLEPWEDSPGEISKHDWKDFLGKRNYQRAFVDFFEDQMVQHGYDWKALLAEFLFEGEEPLINNLVAGLAHPLIHLGYAYELSSRTIATEALTLAACFRNPLHTYLDDPSYTRPSSNPSTSSLEILHRIADDPRFNGLLDHQGSDNIDIILANEETREAVLEHWNALDMSDPKKQFEDCQRTAIALLVATHQKGELYDFFVVHLLTSSHAVRILLPVLPAKWHVPLVRQWWLFCVLVYIAQLRRAIKQDRIADYPLEGRNWKSVDDRAVNGKHATDAHFVKACRAMKEAANLWGDEDKYILKAAVSFAAEFDGWGGFNSKSEEEERIMLEWRKGGGE
ncbi:hypothetical protein LTR50_004167 [Elasticomyces elasticus]|nr:hypothetical protein LTR50_004167 [Elasticomyces elasticus]